MLAIASSESEIRTRGPRWRRDGVVPPCPLSDEPPLVVWLPDGWLLEPWSELAAGSRSSLRILLWPPASTIVMWTGFDRRTVNVSSASKALSPSTTTVTCLRVWPGANVSVPCSAT